MEVVILTAEGDTLRRMTREVEPGWQTLTWRGDTDGIRWPSRGLDKEDKPTGGGPSVAPGTYTAVLTLGAHVDSMDMMWVHDPRTAFDAAKHEEGVAQMKRTYVEVERLADLMQELAAADEAMDAMSRIWAHLGDSTTTVVDSLHQEVAEGITAIHDMIWMPEDFVGYDHVTVRVMSRLYDAMPDMREGVTANDQRKLDIARSAIDDIEAEVRTLMDGPWNALKEAAREVEVTLDGVLDGMQRQDD